MAHTIEQQQAIETDARAVCVDAGAGSGKTRVLIERVVRLLERRLARLDEIVAITFTENAAAEMKARLREAFRIRAPQRNPEEMTVWRDLERRVDTARIATIHSFCSSLLRENALTLGIDPEFGVLADAEAALLLADTVSRTVRELVANEDADLLCVGEELPLPDLRDLLASWLGSRAALDRVAASGMFEDSAALRRHWARLLKDEYRRRLLALRHHPRVRSLIGKLEQFDHLCANPEDGRELRRQAYLDALRRIAGATGHATVAAALHDIAHYEAKRGASKNWASPDTFDRVAACQKSVDDFVKDALPPEPSEAAEQRAAELTTALYRVYRRVAGAYAEAKRIRSRLDFEDLVLRAIEAVREDTELRTRVAAGIRYLFIDEFQDTDYGQLELARLLSSEPGGPHLFIVGDAKQSIYLFRGAEVEVFSAQREASDQVIPLHKNFRSLPDVLAFVNDFFARSHVLAAVQERYASMEAARPARGGARIEFLIPRERGGALADDYRRAEAEMMAARILSICDPDHGLMIERDGGEERAQFRDVAILLRSMSPSYLYEEALRRSGIPYMVVSGKGFYEQQEVIDVLNLLEVLLDPWHERALLAFLRSPMACLSDDALLQCSGSRGLAAAFQEDGTPESLVDVAAWERARALVRELRTQLVRPLPEFLRLLLERTGYEAIQLGQYLGIQRAANVRKLVELADAFARMESPSLRTFIRYVNSIRDESVREGQALVQPEGEGAVTLMTVHKSKGLEFPIVFLPDVSQRRNAGTRPAALLHRALGAAFKPNGDDGERVACRMAEAIAARHQEEQTAEFARLLYVAMTRAREALVFSGAPGAEKGSWLEWLDDLYGLTGREDGETFGESGWSAIVRREPDPVRRMRAPRADTEPIAPETLLRLAQPVLVPPRRPVSLSVSVLLDAMLPPMALPAVERAAAPGIDPLVRGTLIHRLFERWDFRRNQPPPFEQVLNGESLALSERRTALEDLEQAAIRFQASPLALEMAKNRGLKREVPFCLRFRDVLVDGQLDAVLDDGVIIDYKTGRLYEAHERYELQLLLYAAAVHRLRGIIPPRAWLWYVDAGEVREVAVSAARIESVIERAREAIERMGTAHATGG